ncbi:hypothetical protein E2562_021022 [Oryza meyeriana var. granulata]|uniref:Uncharacterized protein n=1 Tax=Oryza meyeriana var. granulata TaxID=110450 RepID=A0A6G1FAS3_9ORYZ|nr:hypothetical protein E2562_021022 [Oryza meyeriana var. granulata]
MVWAQPVPFCGPTNSGPGLHASGPSAGTPIGTVTPVAQAAPKSPGVVPVAEATTARTPARTPSTSPTGVQGTLQPSDTVDD